jgi:15-cis-phytoene synthase
MNDALAASYDDCVDLSKREARNFYWSFRLLPPERRRSMCALYAFMRRSDDLADGPGEPLAKRLAIETWRAELDRALDGQSVPSAPRLLALADTVQRHQIPRRYLHDVLDGCLMDLEPRTYETFSDLHKYCYRVASAVGLCCVHIWGFRSEDGQGERLAEACGLALQLTNILRDVREDANIGRIYLPREDLDRFGVVPADLLAEKPSQPLRALLAFEGRRAYDYYDQSRRLVRLVEPIGRPVLRAIVGIYRALLDEIVRRDYDVLQGRISIPPWRKAAITLRSLVPTPLA